MGTRDIQIQGVLEGVRGALDSDLAALAVIDRRERSARWRWASGNLNNRYSYISIGYGQGIEGEVIKVGRGLVWDSGNAKKRADSILLTEGLQSAYAAPIMAGSDIVGILLAGNRTKRAYGQPERETVTKVAAEIAEWFQDLL
ncbi:GAF domain-containing protein [Cohnella sp. LGH]|uniref:Nitrogen regulatory protein A n=1 Tax=Cohnella phaseoli TaxID=456490 RepID=A0A3D9HRM8_9BACL|nr:MULTISPECIES: GAF domain-containing protein [Cohnella]QTH41455.1 GAF domain-containing protein [Cohnella sp. LGH]RED51981.1 nitrogen regulatory protein A [Cohnella phaseoli]